MLSVRKMKTRLVTLFVLIILISRLGVNSEAINPLKNPGICGIPTCDIDIENEKFRYQPNVAYKYLYESSFTTLFDGTDDNDPVSELHISAYVELVFRSKCQGQLKITSAQLKYYNQTIVAENKPPAGDYEYEEEEEQEETVTNAFVETKENVLHPRSSQFSNDVEKMSIRFDFRDGLIQEICPESEEQVWVVNFKRGILSSLQNTMYRLDLDHKSTEVDVSGKCDVSYQFMNAKNTTIVINKIKDIASCQNRNKFKSIIQTMPYEFRKSGISWWPIFSSKSNCELSIDNYVYNHIECHERHVLIPFSNNEQGAVSKSFMRMKLVAEINDTSSDDIFIESRKSLLYDHTFSPKLMHNDIRLSREFLKKMCTLGFPNIQREFPDRFVKFLSATRQLSEKGLSQLFQRAGGICKNGRKHVLESLPHIGSSASVDLMKNLLMGKIRSNELKPEIKEAWMISMFYLPRPDQKVIESMFSLIQHYEEESNPMYILIPTSVTHTFCRNIVDCRENYVVMNIVKYLEGIVIENLSKDLADKKVYEKLLVSMKGLGNIGFISKQLEEELKAIIIDESYSDDVKLQAIQMFRKTNCDQTRDYFMDIYQNFTQSVEVRIASYLQVMKCPTYLTIKDIKTFLRNEHVNQVGSFVWSHLKNLRQTSSPLKIELQAMLVDNEIDEKFRMDFRKFSKNYEHSLFFDEYNFGLTGESNVIFGIESYFPRSVSFNGTINLFGGSINPFEFNVRIQGLEKYIESIVGIDGPLNFERLVEKFRFIYDAITSYINIDNDILHAILRSRRSTNNHIDGFAYKPNYEFNKPSGYFEHKIFGNDINFYHFDGLDELGKIVEKLVPVERVKNIFSKNQEVFIDSGVLVDAAYSVPSSTGFPLILNGFGAYSLDISYYASINNKNAWETKSLDFTGKLRPSLSMELNTAMQMDLFYASTEIKFKSNVYSNHALETDIKIKNYTHASMKMKLPQDRNDIFSIRTQLLSKIEGEEKLLYGITNRYVNTTCTSPTIDETVGLKVCIDYSLPDVSDQDKVYPSLILSGPIMFDIHLDKADLSAKIFNFEYNWNAESDKSEGSIVFETPNTKIPRKLSATLLKNPTDYNLTMKMVNGERIQKILGLYKDSPQLRKLDFVISENEKPQLELEMSLAKEFISQTRRKVSPTFLLTIKEKKVAGMMGDINILDKNGIRQYDFDLTWETKKLKSTTAGTLLKSDKSTTLDTEIAYKFSGQKEETIEIFSEVANRGYRLGEYIASFKFESSAYPNFNFLSNASFISSNGHAELRLDFNNAAGFDNQAYTLTTKINLAKSTEGNRNSETTFSIEILRPISKTDLKFQIKYVERYKNGTEHTVSSIIRYSPQKEIDMKTSVFIPKGNLFGVDATLTLKIPDMGMCSAEVKIQEKLRKDYAIFVRGEWFKKENIKFVATYYDRTSNVKRYHKLKSIISSNLFDDINLMLKYSRDANELKIDAKSEFKNDSYSFVLESLESQPLLTIFRTELNWADHKYSIFSNSSKKDLGRTKIEIHLDRLRDMHIELWGLAKTFSHNAGIEFKWDANRDPSQKFIFSYDFSRPHPKVYVGNILMSYPDRTLNGEINFSNEGPYTGTTKISWSADEIIDASYSLGSDFNDHRKLWAIFKIDTPFAGWKNNRINGSVYQKDNLLAINFATVWAESQNVEIDFFVDYLLSEKEISSELRGSIQSTIQNIPIVFSHFKYNQTNDELESDVFFKHKNFFTGEDFRTFSMKSLWKKSYDITHKNVSGTITFLSPFQNYSSGAFVTKFSVSTDRQLYGVIDMDIDQRVYSFAVEGYLRKLLDNMISFNISTPIETFPSMLGKFGIIEHKKYLIADLKTFNKSLGIEVLFDFESITDFDLKFYAATPQPTFEKILAIGRIKEDVIHIEGAFNKITLGFKMITHFKKANDFEYSYQVFTPLPSFESNGLIFRVVAKDIQNFDIETSMKLGKYKFGVKGFGEPKKRLINQLGLQKATYIREEIGTVDDLDSEEVDDETKIDIDLAKFYSVSGNFEICTIIWSPIIGNYEIQQIEDTYHGDANIFISKGVISVSNKFIIKNQTDFMNRLKIDTPINNYKTINSNLKVKIPSSGFTTRFDVGVKDVVSKWKNYGFKLSYQLPKVGLSKIHDVSLIILYPVMNTSRININSRFELTKNGFNQVNFTLDGFNTKLDLSGHVDRVKKDINAGFIVQLNSPIIKKYIFSTYLIKTSVEKENQINSGFFYTDDGNENKFDTQLLYRIDSNHIIDGYLSVSSNIFPIQKFNTSVYISEGIQPKFDVQIQYGSVQELMNEIKFLITKNDNTFKGELTTPLKELFLLEFNGNLVEQSQTGNYRAKGKLFKNTIPYDFDGNVVFYQNIPTQVDLTVKAQNDDKIDSTLSYNLKHVDLTRTISAKIFQNDDFLNFESELYIKSLYDWAYNIKMLSSREKLNELMLSTMLTPMAKNQYEASFEMSTPWEKYLVDKINVSSVINLNPSDGDMTLYYEISKHNGTSDCSWKYLQKQTKQDYQFKIHMDSKDTGKHFSTEFSYLNPVKSPTDVLFAVDINSLWKLSSKAKFFLQSTNGHDMSITYDLNLPQPIESNHKIEARYKGNDFPPKLWEKSNTDCFVDYRSSDGVIASLKANGKIETFSNMNNQLNLEWGSAREVNKIGSDFSVSENSEKIVYKWNLITPYHRNEKTLVFNANYDTQDVFKVIHTDINYPESKQITVADIAFADIQNTRGSINSSLPIFNISWFNVNFGFDTREEETTKFIKATWPDNYALIDSKSNFINSRDYKEWKGTIIAEIPLQTKHDIQIIYGLKEQPLITRGDASVEYNNKTVLNSRYTCKTEKLSSDHLKDVIDLNLQNEAWPLGIHYIHEKHKKPSENYDYSKKHLELFDLTRDNRFNITSEFTAEIKEAEQKYKFVAIHPNRTIEWASDYASLDTHTHSKSKIKLADNIWLGYDFKLSNLTTVNNEGQDLKFELSYPKRKISVGGSYASKSDSLDTNLNIQWNKKQQKGEDESESNDDESENKSVEGSFQWKDLTDSTNLNHQSILFAMKHPKFEKDITLQGVYFKDKKTLAKVEIDVDYTEDEDHHAKFISEIKNLSEDVGYKNFTIHVKGDHGASDLHLLVDGSVGMKNNYYRMEAEGNYKRGFLPDMELELLGYIDADNKEIKFYRHTPSKDIHIYGITKPSFPTYSFDGIYIDSPEYDTAGNFIANLKEKFIFGEVNLTADATQQFQVRGQIPNTRSATLNVWRDYEDIRIDDVAYFIQMNHSRLITSKLLWRPTIKKEIKDNLKSFMASRYNALAEELDYWFKTLYHECKDIISGIWHESKSFTNDFREDLEALKDIDEDLSAFKSFLNESYFADDFYIQSLMNYTLTVLDELAIAEHIQTIPKIFKEMWEVLGESSVAFKNSVFWIVEMMKSSYKDSIDIFNKLIHGNSMEYVTQFLNSIIENYDRFVKNLHITFMNYIETMWDNFVNMISLYWSKILQNIEPQILRSIHYVETTLWSISSEIFDFMYNRTNEIMDSPYFVKVSNITHDLDVLYHDVKTNDLFTNLKKYSAIMYKFLKEKIFRVVPFGKEMRDIFTELGNSFEELKKIDTIKEYFDRLEEIEAKLKWLIDEFQLDKRLNALLEILRKKLARITQNALETEDVYREAKTKFIFDPDLGVIDWEQKLPIPWHAFNETPQFEEIPEYKFINDVQTFLFSSSNKSTFSFAYGFFLSEPQNLLPPFKSYALLIGSRHIITFDKTNINFNAREFGSLTRESQALNDECSYLLAHDFIDNRFTIVLKSSTINENNQQFLSKRLLIQSQEAKVEIELGNPSGEIRISDQLTTIQPTKSGDFLITRELNVVTVVSKKGFKVQCNLEFDVCLIELSGWYFGKVAGVLGTMNNEQFDDLTTSDNYIVDDKNTFIESWMTKECVNAEINPLVNVTNFYDGLHRNCEMFFKQKTSYFTSCFTVVDPQSFYDLCLQLGSLPRYQISFKSAEIAACTSAIAYIEACAIQSVPLRIPDSCIHCNLPNGSHITEGTFIKLKDEAISPSADIVFLMEAHSCNTNSLKKNLLSTFVTSLKTEMKLNSIDEVRFAVVSFGGTKEFGKAKTITSNGKVFTDVENIQSYINHIESGGNETINADVSTAITKASELIFKPGAVKIFILSLCSECELHTFKFDFKSVSQLISENDITLHILTNEQFNIKKVLGIDERKAFLKKDQTKLLGDEKTRTRVKNPKKLDECASLPFGANGSIFSTGNQNNSNELAIIAKVFAKRVANVRVEPCHVCECEGYNSGTAYLTCVTCDSEGTDNFYEEEDSQQIDSEEHYLVDDDESS